MFEMSLHEQCRPRSKVAFVPNIEDSMDDDIAKMHYFSCNQFPSEAFHLGHVFASVGPFSTNTVVAKASPLVVSNRKCP